MSQAFTVVGFVNAIGGLWGVVLPFFTSSGQQQAVTASPEVDVDVCGIESGRTGLPLS